MLFTHLNISLYGVLYIELLKQKCQTLEQYLKFDSINVLYNKILQFVQRKFDILFMAFICRDALLSNERIVILESQFINVDTPKFDPITRLHIVSIHIQPLQWRHNGRDDVPNHQPHDCLLNRVFKRRSKKTSKLRFTGKVREIPDLAKVREKSGNFVEGQGKKWISGKVREKSGNLQLMQSK